MILKQIVTKFIVLLALPFCFGFSTIATSSCIGTYASYTESNIIELVINQDNTFSYIEKLCTGKDLKSTGSWESKHNAIILLPEDKSIDFHTKWKFDKEGTKANSRKGLLFYTLRRVL
jgi:hypothetical protein